MTVGFEMYNSDGQLQATDTTPTYYLVSKSSSSSVTTSGLGYSLSMIKLTVAKTYTKPIIAISCGSYTAFVYRGSDSTNWYYYFSVDASPGASYTSYLFQATSALTATSSGVGMEIYSSAGVVTFSTFQPKPMRILGGLSSTTDSQTFTGKTLALVHSSPMSEYNYTLTGWYYENTGDVYADPDYGMGFDWWWHADNEYYYWGGKISGSTAYSGKSPYDLQSIEGMDGSFPETWTVTWKPILILDVTNY